MQDETQLSELFQMAGLGDSAKRFWREKTFKAAGFVIFKPVLNCGGSDQAFSGGVFALYGQ